jgi:hypothetical protein
MARRKAKDRTVSLDFTDVETGGGGFKIPEGDYRMKVESVEDTESDAGNSMFKWTFVGMEKKAKGKKFYLYTVYDPPDSLWKLRSLLEALGQEVPDGPLDLDLDEMTDLEIIGHVEDEEYQNKMTSKLKDFSSVDGAEEEEEEEEEEEKPAKGKKKKKKEEEEEEEEEENPRGKKGKKKKGKKLDAMSAEEVKALEEDEMVELVERYELDLDLDEHKTPRRKASAIIAALEEKELLADD